MAKGQSTHTSLNAFCHAEDDVSAAALLQGRCLNPELLILEKWPGHCSIIVGLSQKFATTSHSIGSSHLHNENLKRLYTKMAAVSMTKGCMQMLLLSTSRVL